jgi:hypothetical protein
VSYFIILFSGKCAVARILYLWMHLLERAGNSSADQGRTWEGGGRLVGPPPVGKINILN